MSLRPLKCYGTCGSKYLKNEMEQVGSLNYCKTCAAAKIKEQTDRDLLYKTIQVIYKIPYPNGQMLKQIREFKETRNYTYEGITKALCYIVKVVKIELTQRGALSILPYYYDSSVKYYEDLEEKMKNTSSIKNEVVTIKIAPIVHSNNTIREKAFIKMKGLE
jgi:hypothetical protein